MRGKKGDGAEQVRGVKEAYLSQAICKHKYDIFGPTPGSSRRPSRVLGMSPWYFAANTSAVRFK